MYVVIVGAGRVGRSLAASLVAAEHEVAVIDRDASRCADLEDELGSIAVIGDGTEAEVLARAGVNRADVFVAATGRDDENLVACQLAKQRFRASKTVSLANLPDHQWLFNMLGIDVTIDATELIVGRIQEELSAISTVEEVGSVG